MLGGEGVGNGDAFLERFEVEEEGAALEDLADDFLASECRELALDGFDDFCEECFGVCGEANDAVAAVFGLGENVCGDEIRISGFVGEDENFAGAGEEVDGDGTDELAFCLDDEAVAGAEDAVHGADGFGPECECGDGLRPADFDGFGDAGGFEGVEEGGVDGAVWAAGGRGKDLGDSGGLGEAGRHECGGDERRFAAWDVNADAVKWGEALADGGTFCIFGGPVFAQAAFGKGVDVVKCAGDGGLGGRGDGGFRSGKLGLADKQSFRRECRVVEAFGERDQCGIALACDVGDDFRDEVADSGLWQGAAVEAADEGRVAGIVVAEDFHAGKKLRNMSADFHFAKPDPA